MTLNVNPAATQDFTISATPALRAIDFTGPGNYTVTVTGSGGFNENVVFSVTGLPPLTSATFTPTSVTGSGTSTLRISMTSPSAPKGEYTLTITGTGTTLTRSTTVTLRVK